MRNEIKAILAATMMITAFSANAGYRMQIPLEIDGGGHLPNGSIVFSGITETTPPETSEPEEQPIFSLTQHLNFNNGSSIGSPTETNPTVNQVTDGSIFIVEFPIISQVYQVTRIKIGERTCIPNDNVTFIGGGIEWYSFGCTNSIMITPADLGSTITIDFY
jgi:hypothetical protein